MKTTIAILASVLALMIASGAAFATNTPCSQKKGGVVGCIGTKFLCRDGSTSASKKTCTRDQAETSEPTFDRKGLIRLNEDDPVE